MSTLNVQTSLLLGMPPTLIYYIHCISECKCIYLIFQSMYINRNMTKRVQWLPRASPHVDNQSRLRKWFRPWRRRRLLRQLRVASACISALPPSQLSCQAANVRRFQEDAEDLRLVDSFHGATFVSQRIPPRWLIAGPAAADVGPTGRQGATLHWHDGFHSRHQDCNFHHTFHQTHIKQNHTRSCIMSPIFALFLLLNVRIYVLGRVKTAIYIHIFAWISVCCYIMFRSLFCAAMTL